MSRTPKKDEDGKVGDGAEEQMERGSGEVREAKTPAKEFDVGRAVRVSVLYSVTSIAVSVLYKVVLTSYQFKADATLLVCQLLCALLLCWVAKRFLSHVPGMEVPDFDADVWRKSAWMGVLWVANIAVGWRGAAIVDMPMFLCIRRTTTVFTMAAQWWFTGKMESASVQGMVVLIVVGTLVAGWDSLSANALGYSFTLCNNMLTAVSMNVTKAFQEATGVRGFGIVYYNALTALPLALAVLLFTGEVDYLAHYPHLFDPRFLAAVAFASLVGVLMTYVVFLSATVNSPLATSVTGNVKDVLSTFIGAWLFHDFVPSFLRILGLAISLLAGIGFGYFKYAEMIAAQKPA